MFTFVTIFLKLFYLVSEKSLILYMKKIILHCCTPSISNLLYAGFRTVFVLVVPSKLSWGCTLEVFVPQNGLKGMVHMIAM